MILECPHCQASHSKGKAELEDGLEVRCRGCGRPFWADIAGTYKERPLAPPPPPMDATADEDDDDEDDDIDDPFLGAPTSVMRAPPSAVIEQLTREALESADLAQTGLDFGDAGDDATAGPTMEVPPVPEPMESETTHPSARRESGIVPIPSGLDATSEISVDGLKAQLDAMVADHEMDVQTDPNLAPLDEGRQEDPEVTSTGHPDLPKTQLRRNPTTDLSAALPAKSTQVESSQAESTQVSSSEPSQSANGALEHEATTPGPFSVDTSDDEAPVRKRPFEEATAVASHEDFMRAIEASRRTTMEVSDSDIIIESSAPAVDPRLLEEPGATGELPLEYREESTIEQAPSLDSLPDAFATDHPLAFEDVSSTDFRKRKPQLPRFPIQELQRWGEAQWRWIRAQTWQVQTAIFGGASILAILLLLLLIVALSDEDRTRYLSSPQPLRPLPDPEAAMPHTPMLLRGAQVVALEAFVDFTLVRDLAGNTGYVQTVLLTEDLPVSMPEYPFADCYKGLLEESAEECTARAQRRYNSCREVCEARPQRDPCIERCQLRLNDCAQACEGAPPVRQPGPVLEEPEPAPENGELGDEMDDDRLRGKKKKKRKRRP